MRTLLGFVLVLGTVGCSASIVVDGDGEGGSGGGGECGEPPPPSGGYCPPSWECIDGVWQDMAGDCPQPACPEQVPAWGSPCDLIGQTCNYDEVDCGGGTFAECTASGWEVYESFCSPPIECPDEAPIAGASCEGWDEAWDCYYAVTSSCGETSMYAYCDTASYTWSVDMPETCDGCAYDTAGGCHADLACRWLVPGCGENPVPFEHCAPDDGCTADSCGPNEVCTTVSIDPCWAWLCNSCSEDVNTCLPPLVGE